MYPHCLYTLCPGKEAFPASLSPVWHPHALWQGTSHRKPSLLPQRRLSAAWLPLSLCSLLLPLPSDHEFQGQGPPSIQPQRPVWSLPRRTDVNGVDKRQDFFLPCNLSFPLVRDIRVPSLFLLFQFCFQSCYHSFTQQIVTESQPCGRYSGTNGPLPSGSLLVSERG